MKNSIESPDLGWTTMSIDDLYSNPSEPPRFIIDSLLPYGVVTLLAAHGGTGKSMTSPLFVFTSPNVKNERNC